MATLTLKVTSQVEIDRLESYSQKAENCPNKHLSSLNTWMLSTLLLDDPALVSEQIENVNAVIFLHTLGDNPANSVECLSAVGKCDNMYPRYHPFEVTL